MITKSYLKFRTIRGTPKKWVGLGKPLLTQLSQNYQFSVKLYFCTEKLTVGHCFWSYTQPKTAPALKPFEDRGRAHAHYAKICT